jgi:hypothetical protein
MMKRTILTVLILASIAAGQTTNPGRVNVVTTPWSTNWLTHATDGAALTDLGLSAWQQSILADADGSARMTQLGISPFAQTLAAMTDANEVRAALEPNTVNVRDDPYLAKGDGVTDDTAAFQAAINARGDRAVIDVPPGLYKLSSALTVSGYGYELTIRGVGNPQWRKGAAAVLWQSNPDANIIESSANTLILEDLCFCSPTDFSAGGIPAGTGNGIVYGNGTFNTNQNWIRRCWFQDIAQDCIVMESDALWSDLWVDGSCFELAGGGMATIGAKCYLDIKDSQNWAGNIEVTGGLLKACDTRFVYSAIDVNTADDTSAYGRGRVSGCSFSQITGAGSPPAIRLVGAENWIVEGNAMWGNQYNHGIYLEDGKANSIVGNVLYMNQGYLQNWSGIYLAGTEAGAIVAANHVENHKTDNTFGCQYGLTTEATTTNVTVAGNSFDGRTAATNILGTLRTGVPGPASASHDYSAGSAAWSMTTQEALGSLFTVTNAGGAADAVFPVVVPGKSFSVYNNSGQAVTFKVAGQAGAATTTGKYSTWTMNATDCVLIYEQP